MPMYDFRCLLCERTFEALRRISDTNPACSQCGGATEKWMSRAPGVISDGVPGGFVVENIGSKPMRFDSKSEYKRELEARGLEPKVRHIGTSGSDKSPHTTSWSGCDPLKLAPSHVLPPELRPKPELSATGNSPLVTDDPMITAARPKSTTDIVAATFRELGGE